jgi:hypothetical protein
LKTVKWKQWRWEKEWMVGIWWNPRENGKWEMKMCLVFRWDCAWFSVRCSSLFFLLFVSISEDEMNQNHACSHVPFYANFATILF